MYLRVQFYCTENIYARLLSPKYSSINRLLESILKMDVIFLNGEPRATKFFMRYVGPYKVAHWIRKHGYQCQVLDFVTHFREEKLYKMITKFITADTSVIALSSTFLMQTPVEHTDGIYRRIPETLLNVLKTVMKENPSIKVVVGGYMSEKISGYGIIDATVMSYTTASEDVFLEYLNYLKKKGEAPLGTLQFPWPEAPGDSPKPRMVYDTARFPTYSIETDDFKFTAQDVIMPGEPLPLDVSRGCIFACRFCQFPHLGKGKLDYIRGMNYIEDELRFNYENFGTTSYYVLDDTFNDTEIKMKAFYDMTQRLPFKITFAAYIRADLLHRFTDTPYMLQESGLFGAYHGIESLHPEASKVVGKAWSGKHAREYIPELYHNIWKGQIPVHTNFIVGLPHEPEAHVIETAKWFVANNLYSIKFAPLGLFGPGNNKSKYTIQSEFDRNAEKYGFTFDDEPTDNFESTEKTWKNNQWTTKSAKQFAAMLTEKTKPYRKLNVWFAPARLWYGETPEEILTSPRTDDYFETKKERSVEMFKEYYRKVMAL